MNKNNKSEKQQNINKMFISEEGEIIKYKIDNFEIIKNITNGYYELNSICKLCNKDITYLTHFIKSQRFNFIIHCYDNNFDIHEYVYFIKFNDGIKIGRTFNINKRYEPIIVKNMLLDIIPIRSSEIEKCEKELITMFSSKYERSKGREKFDIKENEIKQALKTFKRIATKYSISTKKINNNNNTNISIDHINNKRVYYISPLVSSILLNIFGNRSFDDALLFIDVMEKTFNNISNEDYLALFQENKERFFYWKYHGYTVVVNLDRKLFNASRLWNTIINSEHYKHKNKDFKEFLKSDFVKNMIKENNENKPITLTYKNKPLLNGRYMPLYFVHFILHELDTKYAYKVAKMMTESLFEKAKNKAINDNEIIDAITLHGGNNEYEFNEMYLMEGIELLYDNI